MNSKKARRESAMKKSKQKKIITLSAGALVITAFAILLVVSTLQQTDGRVYAAGSNRVVLYEDGSFTARLPHNVRKSGTYTERTENNVTTVSFRHGGRTVMGIITNDILSIPHEWRDNHGHATEYVLR